MKKLTIIIALLSLITAAQAQVKPTTFEKVSDSLWLITEPILGGDLVQKEAFPISHAQLTVDINNRIRKSAGFVTGGIVCSWASILSGFAYSTGKGDVYKTVSIFTGVASFGLSIVALANLFPSRVTATPDGIILKIGKNTGNRSITVQKKMKK